MSLFPTNSPDPQLTNAVRRLIGHDDFQALLKHWEEITLPLMYREACGGASNDRREWMAGRANLLQEMIDDVRKLKQRRSEFSARPVAIGKAWNG